MAKNLRLSDGDKTFLKLIEDGMRPSAAFKEAYPTHKSVLQWHRSEVGSPDRQKAAESIAQVAKFKLDAQYIQKAQKTYQDSMEKFSELSVETAIDLVKNARSEKVRADLAIEGMRHKVGAPTTKVQVQEERTVYLTFGAPPAGESNELEGDERTFIEPIDLQPSPPQESEEESQKSETFSFEGDDLDDTDDN